MQFAESDSLATYNACFRKYYPALLAYASHFLDSEQAEDMVQDAFMDLWHRRDQIQMNEHIKAFLYKSIYTRSLNMIKHMTVVRTHSQAAIEIYKKKAEYLNPDSNEIARRIDNDELSAEVYKVIETLPEKCREVFKLSYLHDMRNKQIAEVLGISIKTVEAHMYKALKLLRERLKHLAVIAIIIATVFKNLF